MTIFKANHLFGVSLKMQHQKPVCEHCGHVFVAGEAIHSSIICPACGLTAHPLGKSHPLHSTISIRWDKFLFGLVLVLLFGALVTGQLVQNIRLKRVEEEVGAMFSTLADLETALQLVIQKIERDAVERIVAPLQGNGLIERVDGETLTRRNMGDAEQKVYAAMKRKLDRQCSACQMNSWVKLRQLNGRIRRGRYMGMEHGDVVLQDGDTKKYINGTNLDHSSRLRADPAFREKAILYETDKALQDEM